MFRSWLSFFILTALLSVAVTQASAQSTMASDPNLLFLDGGVKIKLPLLPEDPILRQTFLALSPTQQQAFYIKRNIILTKLVSGLSRPGLKNGFRWVKDKIFAAKDYLKNKFSAADTVMSDEDKDGADTIEKENKGPLATPFGWEDVPPKLSEKGKALIESVTTGLIDNMWRQSDRIARLSGMGFTFVGGAIFNTTLPKLGYVWGRGLSVDIGVDFKTGKGYVRFFYDKQRLNTGGLSVDVGLMGDFLLHLTDPELTSDKAIEATHVKLPVIGCFRHGPDYLAWGSQLGVSVVELAGAWLTTHGYPKLGPSLAAGMRAVGLATVYSTQLTREPLSDTYEISEETLRKIGLGKLLDTTRELRCAEAMNF